MLKTLSVTVTVLALLALGVWMLPGTDQEGISGIWRLSVRLADSGSRTGSLVLIQDGETLTGTYTGVLRRYGQRRAAGTMVQRR